VPTFALSHDDAVYALVPATLPADAYAIELAAVRARIERN
jgi:hypothetical protein